MSKARVAGLITAAACMAATVVSLVPTAANAVVADPSKKRLSYVVAPHPDDELQGWSLVQNSPDNYNVFIVLTRGEATGYCTGSGYEGQYGERHPLPNAPTASGFGTQQSAECKAQRLNSREGWLDKQANQDPNLGTGAGMTRFRLNHPIPSNVTPMDGSTVAAYSDWQVGPKSARVAFDLGDGDLSTAEVNWAIQTVRSNRGQLPTLPEGNIVGASYNNAMAGCYIYDRPDHRAVHQALYNTDQGTPGVQWGATCKNDPDAVRFGTITDTIYTANMAPVTSSPGSNPSATRTGHFQVEYGWLAFDGGGYWQSSTNNQGLWSQTQSFWQRY